MGFTPHSTRLFPKFQGAEAYVLTGIAARCDRVVLSDRVEPHVADRLQTDPDSVRTVFVSLRAHEYALTYFLDTVLPQLHRPFVLITGSEDVTLPHQVDKRWPALPGLMRERLFKLAKHPLLLAWFCENLDTCFHPKVRPLPLGMVYPDSDAIPATLTAPEWGRTADRYRRVLCAHRVREGAQWEPRRTVTALARSHWRPFTTVLEAPVDEVEYEALIHNHAFVLCVEGGGLDPSPKAWKALLNGAVPIIRRTAVSEAYAAFPVVTVGDWTEQALCPAKIETWFTRYFRTGFMRVQREMILERLGIEYWWASVQRAFENR